MGLKVLDDNGARMGKANTSLLLHHRRFYALEDADLPYRVDLSSLRTIGRSRFKAAAAAMAGDDEDEDHV